MSTRPYMQLFVEDLRKWAPRIKKATYASEVQVTSAPDAARVKVIWPATKAGPAGELELEFTRERVLGSTAGLPPLQQRPVKKTCRTVDDIVQAVLRQRGV